MNETVNSTEKPEWIEDVGKDKWGKTTARFLCQMCNTSWVTKKGPVINGRITRCNDCGKIKDLRNKRFDKLTAIDFYKYESNGKTDVFWNCICDCGRTTSVTSTSLSNSINNDCGFCKFEEMIGEKFGRWTVISAIKVDARNKVLCECSCNKKTKKTFVPSRLIYGDSKSCGCYHKDIVKTHCGENHYRWNYNLTDEEREIGRGYPEYYEWRKTVFERDGYTCQICGDNRGGNLVAHHLDGYNWCIERRLDITNGITLCDDNDCQNTCHPKFHNHYGYGDNTEEQFWEFYIKMTNGTWS
jgi:hypothetical protein